MKSSVLLSVALALALIFPSAILAGGAGERLAGPIPAQVMRVVDGDTIVVRAHIWLGQEVETMVRLSGTDAPELKGRCPAEREKAEAAKAFLSKRLDGVSVQLRDVLTDKYGGRVLAQVLDASGADLSAELVKAGLARPYGGEKRQPWCGDEP